MPEPIISTPNPVPSQADESELIEMEPLVVVGSKPATAPPAPPLNAPYTGAEIGYMIKECASEIDAIVIAAIAAVPASLPLAALGGLKLGLDYGTCAEEGQAEVMRQREAVACRLEDGIPLLTADHRVHCQPRSKP